MHVMKSEAESIAAREFVERFEGVFVGAKRFDRLIDAGEHGFFEDFLR